MLLPKIVELPGVIIPEGSTIESLKTAGNYDSQSDRAERFFDDERFKVTAHGPRRLLLAHFDVKVTSEYVEIVAREMGNEVALVEDLLCAGAHPKHREWQQFLIVAVGSFAVVDSLRYVPCHYRWNNGRHLDMTSYDGYWQESYRFLFVGKN
jgi:hypothetical protein